MNISKDLDLADNVSFVPYLLQWNPDTTILDITISPV